MANKNFDDLVQSGLIKSPGHFSDGDKQQLEKLSGDEIAALKSIRAKLGDDFLTEKGQGKGGSPSVAIVF